MFATRGRLRIRFTFLCFLVCPYLQADSDPFSSGVTLIGETSEVAVREGELLLDIARRHSMGYEEMRLANLDLDPWIPEVGARVTIPGRHILPMAEQRGIVLNLAEKRLYFYPEPAAGESRQVYTFPVGIGRKEWPTPLGATRVVGKVVKPTWYPPMSIRIEHAANGDPLPSVVPPGPDNPLGDYALLLDKPGYLIHGTNKPDGIGMRVSHGCVRMYPEDIAVLFERVKKETPVLIIDQPYKATVYQQQLYVEVHPVETDDKPKEPLWRAIRQALDGRQDISWRDVEWPKVQKAFERADGIPVAVTPPPAGDQLQRTVDRLGPPDDQGAG